MNFVVKRKRGPLRNRRRNSRGGALGREVERLRRNTNRTVSVRRIRGLAVRRVKRNQERREEKQPDRPRRRRTHHGQPAEPVTRACYFRQTEHRSPETLRLDSIEPPQSIRCQAPGRLPGFVIFIVMETAELNSA